MSTIEGFRELIVYQKAYALVMKMYIKAFSSKLSDSLGEEYETESWIDFSKDCMYINDRTCKMLMDDYDEVRKMLFSMINNPEKFCSNSL